VSAGAGLLWITFQFQYSPVITLILNCFYFKSDVNLPGPGNASGPVKDGDAKSGLLWENTTNPAINPTSKIPFIATFARVIDFS